MDRATEHLIRDDGLEINDIGDALRRLYDLAEAPGKEVDEILGRLQDEGLVRPA